MITRPKLNLKQAYERVKSKLTGVLADIAALWPIAKNSAGNGIYNGKFTVNQKADISSPVAMVNGGVQIDMWKSVRNNIAGNLSLVDGWLKAEATLADGSLGFSQTIEDFNKYAGETVTISTLIKSSRINARIYIDDGVDTYTQRVTNTDVVNDMAFTFTVDSAATQLIIYIMISSSAGGTATISSGDYIEFGGDGVRLDLGSHRLSGDREYGEELALCRGYWYQPDSDQAYANYADGIASSTTRCHVLLHHGELQAIADTLSTTGNLKLTSRTGDYAVTAIVINTTGCSKTVTALKVDVASGLVANGAYALTNDNDATAAIGFGNEL